MSEPLHVLQVEDSESDAALIVRLLERAGYEVHSERVEDAGGMRAALAKRTWDVIVADYHLPQFGAPAALAIVHETGRDIPFIVVSGNIGEAAAVGMMKSGAHDYLMKDSLARLAPAVEREVREAGTRRERKNLEGQFRQAQKLENIGRLAGGVAHDFNNLLIVISGYSQMLLDEMPVRHPFRERIEEIAKAGARATAMTRQLLTFSRRQIGEPQNVVLNDVLRDFEKMLARLIGEDIQLVLSLDPEAGAVRADPGHIEQVVLNLAVNAKDAMPGGGRLIIETSSFVVDEHFAQTHLSVVPGTYIMLAVTDTGVGMPSEVREHIFEPFFTTKEPGKGTGLGLSTVYGIVTQSGGSIRVYSEPGRGTSFKILFPSVAVETQQTEPARVAAAPGGKETILVAEDDDGVRKYVRDILEHHGYTVLETSNGREAIGVAREYPAAIHLLLTDSVMPEIGGAALIGPFSVLRPGVPVLCMSGYGGCIGPDPNGMPHYIQKPFSPAALLIQVRALLGPP